MLPQRPPSGVGDVVDDELRCMFHHFCYGADGRCTKVRSRDRIPSSARVHSFPVAESVGLVWVFNGEAPPSPPPGVADYDPAVPGLDVGVHLDESALPLGVLPGEIPVVAQRSD